VSRMRTLIDLVESAGRGSVPDGYWRDNPGGEWLRDKQEDAEIAAQKYRSLAAQRLLRGRTTAKATVTLPTAWLATIPGAKDEIRAPGEQGYDSLTAKVDREGWDHEKANGVVLAVNQRGEPYIYEGNTRIAVARVRGIHAMRVEVQWVNGGEDVAGPATPAKIAALVRQASDLAESDQIAASLNHGEYWVLHLRK